MKLDQAYHIASDLVELLSPLCERAEIAGSIRRKKADVKDIEIVVQPTCHEQRDLFNNTTKRIYPLYEYLDGPFKRGIRMIKGAQRYRQYSLPDGINLDLFIVLPPAQWGVLYLIRTGPAAFSNWLVSTQDAGGAMPWNMHCSDGRITSGSKEFATPEEIDVFNLLGIPWIKPEDRWNHISELLFARLDHY